ncbi:MAG: hypothetical protein ACRD0A_02265 [Acidimicrobiales bacterium]
MKQRRRRPFTPVIAAVVGLATVWGWWRPGRFGSSRPSMTLPWPQAGFDGGAAAERGDFEANDIRFAAADDEAIPADFRPPDEVAGADFDAGFEATNRDGWLAMHDDDGAAIAVYQQLGEYRVGSLPGGGEPFEIDGSRAWRSPGVDGRNAIVVQRGGMTSTLVAEVDIAENLPERDTADTSWGERLTDAVDRFLDAFSLGI